MVKKDVAASHNKMRQLSSGHIDPRPADDTARRIKRILQQDTSAYTKVKEISLFYSFRPMEYSWVSLLLWIRFLRFYFACYLKCCFFLFYHEFLTSGDITNVKRIKSSMIIHYCVINVYSQLSVSFFKRFEAGFLLWNEWKLFFEVRASIFLYFI